MYSDDDDNTDNNGVDGVCVGDDAAAAGDDGCNAIVLRLVMMLQIKL